MCTGIRMTANGGEVFWGRTMDLAAGMFGEDPQSPLPGSLIQIPKNITINSQLSPWQTKYGVVGVGQKNATALYDGINEVGLAGDLQVLVECTHDTNENITARNQIPVLGEEFVTYILTQFSSVEEIRNAYKNYALSDTKYNLEGFEIHVPVHFVFVDESGDGIVLEPVNNGSFKAYDYIGIMTNSPEYDYHIRNINNYIGLNTADVTEPNVVSDQLTLNPIETGTGYGLFGLPGDYTSPSRFVRGGIIPNNMDSFDAKDGINTLYSAFRSVIIPRGLEHSKPNNPLTDYTRYWSGYDLSKREVYVQSGNGLAISSLTINNDLDDIKYTDVDTTDHIHSLA